MPKRNKKIILCPLGSWGDVHPFVWIGKLLVRRCYRVVALTAPQFEDAMHHVGIETITMGTKEEFDEIARDPDLWHPRRAFEIVFRNILPRCKPVIDILRKENVPGETLLIAAGIAFGARIAAEAFEIPLLTVQLQPSVFFSAINPSVVAAGMEWVEHFPYPLRRLLFELVHLKLDSILKKKINALRHNEGLRGDVSRIMENYWMSPQGVLAAFPDWFARRERDWPPQTVLTRFPLYDEYDRLDCPRDLDAFLSAGEPPLLFTPGTANLHAREFFREAAQTVRQLHRRAIFVTRYADQLPADLPETIRAFSFVPFSHVFPRCAAIVHHGGIGTSSQGLAAGVPQFVMAMSHDQPDNALRLKRLGVGDYVYPKRFRADIITPRIDRLLRSDEVTSACAYYRQRTQQQMSESAFVELIEKLGKL